MNLGWTEIIVIVGLALLFFGPARLPGLGKSMGEAIRGFKKGLTEKEDPHPSRDVSEQITHDSKGSETGAKGSSGQTQTSDDKQRQS